MMNVKDTASAAAWIMLCGSPRPVREAVLSPCLPAAFTTPEAIEIIHDTIERFGMVKAEQMIFNSAPSLHEAMTGAGCLIVNELSDAQIWQLVRELHPEAA